MLETKFYHPVNPRKFWHNLRRRAQEYSGRLTSYNSEIEMSNRRNSMLIYHIGSATVHVHNPNHTGEMVSITADNSNSRAIERARLLLEEVARDKLGEVELV